MRRYPLTLATPDGIPDELDLAGDRHGLAEFLARGIVVLVVAFLAICTFEGALRYYAARAGMPWAVYAKDAVLLLALGLGILHTGLTNLRLGPFWIVAGFAVAGTVVGVLLLPDLRQPLFAAKTWLPLVAGTAVASALDLRSRFFVRACALLWLAAVAGVVVTVLWNAPWIGFTYDVGGVALEGSREWTIGETSRAPGFSRASFDAAMQCIFFGAVAAGASRRLLPGALVWLGSAAAAYFTLSRSAMIGLVVAIGLHVFVSATRGSQRVAKVSVFALAVLVAALPFAAQVYFRDIAGTGDTTTVTSLSSFEERALQTWPDGLALASREGNWLTGRGLGGIGVAQQFFEPDLFNPGDNFFVYLWGAFGAGGVLLLAYVPWRVLRAHVPLSRNQRVAIVAIGAFLAIGLTLNGIEAAIASLFLGLALGWMGGDPEAE